MSDQTPYTGRVVTAIPPEVANHVLFYFGEGGYRPGSFTESLLRAIARADHINRARLGLGFPAYVEAMSMAIETESGLADLAALAKAVAR